MMTAIEHEDDDREFARACYESPAFFAREVLGVKPTPQQRQLFDAVAGEGAHVAVRSGHGVGKSTALAVCALWFLCTRDDAKVPCTAPSAHQLEDVLWSEIRRLHYNMSDYMQSRIQIKADKVTRAGSAGYIVARTARPENPDALQGFHADNILFIIDEAAGVPEKVFEVARGALSTPNARAVMTGNPTQLTGYFHNSFHLARDSWVRLCFSCLDSPLVDPSYAADIAAEYGEDSDMYQVRVLGEFPKHGLLSMISADWVEAAMGRTLPPSVVAYAPVILGVDPAWMGTDRSAVFMRKGIYAEAKFVGREVDGVRLAAIVAGLQEELKADATFIDQTGVGASVCDQMRNIGRQFTPISFGGKALNPERFANRRAEMWWAMREWFQGEVALRRRPDLKEDLIGPEYGFTAGGKTYLESKDDMRKRGLASPDLGDALALTFAAPVVSQADIELQERLEAVYHNERDIPYDPFKREQYNPFKIERYSTH